MVKYLQEISKQSYRLLKQDFATLFKIIDEKFGSQEQEEDGELNRMAEMLVELQGDSEEENENEEEKEDEDIDLMSTDDEEDEIGSETEEDRAFLNDEWSMPPTITLFLE